MTKLFGRERLPVIMTAVVLLVLYCGAGLKFTGFFSPQVFLNLFSDNAFLGIVAIGLTFVILSGGIDLSVGSVVGCSSILLATLVQKSHVHPSAAIFLVLLFGTGIGASQGWLIQRFKLPPFLVTLGGLFMCRGIGLAVSRESIQISHPTFKAWSESGAPMLGGTLSLVAFLFLAFLLLASILLRQTRFGRTVYAIGGNEASASLMGLSVDKTKLGIYTISGACSALGGVAFALYTSSGNAVSGTGLELDAIAAVVIGGTLLTGGHGSMFGTLLGVLTLGVIQTAITFDGTLSSWWTKIFIGGLLLVFVLLQRVMSIASIKRTRSMSVGKQA